MSLRVKIFSDYVCPYCYIGEGLVDQLLREPDMALDIRWLPFELHPDTPPEGRSLIELFHISTAQLAQMHRGLRQRAAEVGLPMDPPGVLFNTRRAHRLAEYASDRGRGEAVRRRLFQSNFVEGRNLAADDVLKEAAIAAGLDGDAALAAIDDDKYEERLRSAMLEAQRFGVTGVPAFIIEDRYRIVGALPYNHLLAAFRQIQHELSL